MKEITIFVAIQTFFSSSLTLPPNDDHLSSAVYPWTDFILQVRNPGSLSHHWGVEIRSQLLWPSLFSAGFGRISWSYFLVLTKVKFIWKPKWKSYFMQIKIVCSYHTFLFLIMYLIIYLSFLLTSNILTFLESRYARTIIETPLTNLFMNMLALAWQWQVWRRRKHS